MEQTSVNSVLIEEHHHRAPEAPRPDAPFESLITQGTLILI